jgi:Cu(I)/Ag(I) efflux system membrane fusion protein
MAVAVVGVAAWYAHARGWLAPAYDWVHHLASKDNAGKPDQGGMGMNMPGMDIGGMPMGSPSQMPGHAEVNIPAEIQQRIGVTLGRVEEAPLRMSVRTVGIVHENETKVARVHLRTEGWVQKLYVDYTGQKVRQGDALLSIYSPQFLTTQQELLNARQAAGGGSGSLANLARRRLELWDVPADEIRQLEQTGRPQTYLTLRSPIAGTVLAKNVFQGQYVTPQAELYEVADLSTVWVQAKVYEYELPHVQLGQAATVTVAAVPGRTFTGKVVFVQPIVQEPTRTVQVRVELPNPDGLLKPGMFTQVVIQHTMGKGLLVPTAAVIRTGERDIAYRVAAPGHFLPVPIKISPFRFEAPQAREGGRFQVLEGLRAGEEVVTSADFLIDSESRLRVGMGGMMPGMPGMNMGGMKGMDHGQPPPHGKPGMDLMPMKP